MNWLLDKWTDWQLRQQREGVNGSLKAWRIIPVWLVIMALGALDGDDSSWQEWSAGLGLTVFAAWGATSGLRARLAYRHGWNDRETAMFTSMDEAHARGLTPSDWVMAEAERRMMSDLLPPPARHRPRRRQPPDGSHEDIP